MMETKLSEITPTYRSFENDQVLTAGQLNEFLNYFDDQDRLTRIALTGVGIVCGFKLTFTADQELIISQGCGVTTDGDLITLQETIADTDGLKRIDIDQILYTHYAEFIDDKALYKPFFYKPSGSGDVQIPLWELLPTGDLPNNGPISALPELNKKVVLLYLESYNDDDNLCVGLSCDNQGVLQVQNLRVLVCNEEDADYILSHDPLFDANNILETYFSLSDVTVPRVIVNQQTASTFALLNQSYNAAINLNNSLLSLKTGMSEMLDKLDMQSSATTINLLLDGLFSSGALPQNTLYFQYRYDLYKDVVDTYSELKQLFLKGGCTCMPDIHSFPKHLMLGKLIPTVENIQFKQYRHGFYKSPVLCCDSAGFGRFQFLITRLIEQLRAYVVGTIPYTEIKITPSRYGYPSLLGEKAIPYYYNLQNNLLDHWNYEKTQQLKQRRNLSYHRNLLAADPAIQTPLLYNLEPHNFLRIEGHQGRNCQDALIQLNTIKENNGLSFDIKALGITVSPNETINLDDYACEFGDLQAILDAFIAENNCLLANASFYLSSYSVTQPAVNYRKMEYLYGREKMKKNMSDLTKAAGDSNPVRTNLDSQDNTMGKVVGTVLETFEGCSAADIIAQVNVALQAYDFQEWDHVTYDATVGKPMEMLAYAYEYAEHLPAGIEDMTPAVMQAYQLNAANVCQLSKQVQAVITGEVPPSPPPSHTGPIAATADSPAAMTAAEKAGVAMHSANMEATTGMNILALPQQQSMLLLLANQLADICCNTKKLQAIYDEIEARKAQILLRLKLSEFVKMHPGLEHLAGTQQGGTFILVYITNAMNGIAANSVVADFTLPYSCCSDCAPINFIVPRPVVELFISKNTYCIGTDTEAPTFFSVPEDGVIATKEPVDGLKIENKKLIINSASFNAVGVPIYFTLNGQDTDCHITVFKAPKVEFDWQPENPSPDPTITFFPVGSYQDGSQFFWDFGDGTTSTEKSPPPHTYTLPIEPNNTVDVTLTVTGPDGSCPGVRTKTVEFTQTVTVNRVDEGCHKIGLDNGKKLEGLIAEKMSDNQFKELLTSAQQGYFESSKNLLKKVLDNSMSAFGGDMNAGLFEELFTLTGSVYNMLTKLYADTALAPETRAYRLSAMAQLYVFLLRLILIIINCQGEGLKKDKAFIKLMDSISKQASGDGEKIPPVADMHPNTQKETMLALKQLQERMAK